MRFKGSWLILGLMVVPPVMAQSSFQGDWLYQQTCGWKHSANLHLTQQGNQVKGHWGDGTARGHGEGGSLEGTLTGGTLLVHFCVDDPEDGSAATKCPQFNQTITDHFVLHKNDLIWYQQIGKANDHPTHDKYLMLHRVISGKKTPVDNDCPDDE